MTLAVLEGHLTVQNFCKSNIMDMYHLVALTLLLLSA